MLFFLDLVEQVVEEYDPELRETFDRLLTDEADLESDDLDEGQLRVMFADSLGIIDSLPVKQATLLMRAFAAFFHCANICEENYRVNSLKQREAEVSTLEEADPVNEMTVAYRELALECGQEQADRLLAETE
ncbi:MAG: phosphoenolpyruvate carboxylase, partial [Olegusella sp.]|nr:phosphoenolpyruvate carboxylase [Olegusella sp.]